MTAPTAYVSLSVGPHLAATTTSTILQREGSFASVLHLRSTREAVAYHLDALFRDWLSVVAPSLLWRPALSLLMAPQLYDGYIPTAEAVTSARERIAAELLGAIAEAADLDGPPHLSPLTIPLSHLLDLAQERRRARHLHSVATTREQQLLPQPSSHR